MKQKTLARGCTAPDGIIHTGKDVLFYSRYSPVVYRNTLDTYKVGAVGSTGRVNWSLPLIHKPADAVMRVGNPYAIMERGGPFRYLVTLGPRMRMDHGLSVGMVTDPATPTKWVVRTNVTEPYVADVRRGPRGAYYVWPDTYYPAPILRGGDQDDFRVYHSRVLLVDEPHDRVIVRRGADGELYAINHRVLANEYNFFRFPEGCLPGRKGYAIWGGCPLPGVEGYEELLDFDVSPDGRTLAVAIIVNNKTGGGAREGYGYARQLWMYDLSAHDTPVDATLRTQYEWPCQYVSYSPDGLTLAMVGNNNWLRCGHMETLTVVDVD